MESVSVVDTRPDRTKTYEPFKPILDRILVRALPEQDESGFAVPKKYRQQTNRGEVVAVGDGVVLGGEWHPLMEFVNVGDRVMYGEYTSEKFDRDAEELFIIRVQDIRGVERLRG